ncbi:hypothetical protein, partial [Arachidicoccus sp.]|uniref:hypothetical protein n=1 Tax=Arachidicoccus sp. TaxID=1872624 RepID=UPI003D24E7F9
MIDNNYYNAPQQSWWQGREDGNQWKQLRWWQSVQLIQLNEISRENLQQSFVFLGFECDEGV